MEEIPREALQKYIFGTGIRKGKERRGQERKKIGVFFFEPKDRRCDRLDKRKMRQSHASSHTRTINGLSVGAFYSDSIIARLG